MDNSASCVQRVEESTRTINIERDLILGVWDHKYLHIFDEEKSRSRCYLLQKKVLVYILQKSKFGKRLYGHSTSSMSTPRVFQDSHVNELHLVRPYLGSNFSVGGQKPDSFVSMGRRDDHTNVSIC